MRLADAYDVAMLDLDGVVYIGGSVVQEAPGAIAAARDAGMRIAFITNNASRSTSTTAEHLTELGVPAAAEDVVNSAQAAARLLRDQFGPGARVAVLGAEGLLVALAEVGLVAVDVESDAEAIVSGYGPDVAWRDIMRAATRIRAGLPWVASNTDGTIPASYGVAPGHGVVVDMIRRFAGVEPAVAGKPAPPLVEETIRRTGATRPLMVGDRLDTDIAGAANAGIDSLLVMTGVTDIPALVTAGPQERPTYISADLRGLTRELHPLESADGRVAVGGWTAAAAYDGIMAMMGDGSADDWWHALASAAWGWLDATGTPADVSRLQVPEQVASPA